MSDASTDRVPRRAWLTLVLALVATGVSVALLLRMRPETSIEGMLDPGDPSVVAMGRVLDGFPIAGEMLVLATLPPGAANDDGGLLAFAARLEAAVTAQPADRSVATVRYGPPPQMRAFVERVIVPNGLDYLDDASFGRLTDRLTRAGMDQQLARNRQALSVPGPAAGELGKVLLKDPLRLHEFLLARLAKLGPGVGGAASANAGDAFFSPDRRSLLLRITGARPPGDIDFSRRITADVTRLAADANTGGLAIDVTGAYAVAAHSARAIRGDAIGGVVVTVAGIALVFWVFQRRPLRSFGFSFVPMAFGMLWGFGAYAAFHDTFTPLAAVVGGALGGVGIDYFVFFLAHHARDRRAQGPAAVAVTLARLRRPLLAAWLTSAIGFLAIAGSPIRVLRDFAIVGTLALFGAYLATIWLLPALLTAFDRGEARATPPPRFTRPLGRWLARHARVTLGIAVCVWLVLVGSLAFGRGPMTQDADLMVLHPRPNPPIEAQRRIAVRMGIAPGTIQLYLRASTPDALLRLAHAVERRLDVPAVAAAGLTGSFGVASILPDPDVAAARRATIDPTLASRAPDDLRAAATAAGFRAAAFETYGAFLGQLLAPAAPPPTLATLADYPEVAALVVARGPGPNEALGNLFFATALDRRDDRDAALAAVTRALAGLDGVTVTGMGAINAHVEAAVRRDLPRLLVVALACIAACLLVHFRSVGLGLLAIVPTVVSITCVLAFMELTGQSVNLVNMVAVPLLLGIDVDYSILTISAWARARSRGELVRAFPTTFGGVLTCVATTIVGFGSLATTSVPAVRSLGVLITVGVLSCLAAQLLVLWPILHLMPTRRPPAASSQ